MFLQHALPHATADYLAPGFQNWPLRVLAGIARAGALGVDLFFALSAYLITELLLRERRSSGVVDIRAFYIRRILRIWPLYYFALLILVPAMSIFPGERMPWSDFLAFGFFPEIGRAPRGAILRVPSHCCGPCRLRSSSISPGLGWCAWVRTVCEGSPAECWRPPP